MFESSHAFGFFDYFRVPYRVVSGGPPASLSTVDGSYLGRLWCGERGLLWPRAGAPDCVTGRFTMAGMPVPGRVCTTPPGAGWQRAEAVTDERGRHVAFVWTDGAGNTFLPYDPAEVMRCLWSEAYTRLGRGADPRALMLRGYYLVRPLLPRQVQLGLRRAYAGRQETPRFPAWPVEHGLHDLYDWLFGVLTGIAGAPVPWLAPWPHGKSWSLVLTHDVETAAGFRDIPLLRDPERALGYRSSWNLVGERYHADPVTVRRLRDEGCEIGVHGLRHDGRDLGSRRLLARRLPAMHRYAAEWGAIGFRSPATQRSWDMMRTLGFDYDSSYTDTDPYEPRPGGCCTYLPFRNGDLVELPITLPQDHTLFEILRQRDGSVWTGKARAIRDRGGMVLALTHPDYASGTRAASAYRALLTEFAGDPTVWQALPREVSAWWRRRGESVPVPDGDGWRIDGPAADDGRIRYTAPTLVGEAP
ncbi:hypothetical protein [Actinocatenispora rupis]|uniref:Polysaccharide deacetylase n=1 Tax=Actinocatenispora rupis TaxID=519421 RepID=A0A8J3NCI2_9ACTN|nr:hypothetical protein [Actinocatenispora rupis]GID11930.1 hypothetical protein Aru02nite_28190 [Actinocatenispora rupis]